MSGVTAYSTQIIEALGRGGLVFVVIIVHSDPGCQVVLDETVRRGLVTQQRGGGGCWAAAVIIVIIVVGAPFTHIGVVDVLQCFTVCFVRGGDSQMAMDWESGGFMSMLDNVFVSLTIPSFAWW